MRKPSPTLVLVLAAVVAGVGVLGLAAAAVTDGGATLVAGSALVALVGASVLLGHGFEVAFETWPRTWVVVPALLVASGALGLLDAAGAFGSVDLFGAPIGVGLVVVGVGLLVRGRGDLPAERQTDRRPRDADGG